MKRHSPHLINNVRELRRAGKSYKEINQSLKANIPKSTLSYICKDIQLSEMHINNMKLSAAESLASARRLANIKNKELFKVKLSKIRQDANFASKVIQKKEVAKIALAMLYLGEGAKWKGRRGLLLGSSDPRIIKIYMGLLESCYGIKKDQFRCRIQQRADQNSRSLLNYWSGVTQIPHKQFYPSYIDKRTIGKKTMKTDYKGVCVLTCAGTVIQLELDAIADIISVTWGYSSVG